MWRTVGLGLATGAVVGTALFIFFRFGPMPAINTVQSTQPLSS